MRSSLIALTAAALTACSGTDGRLSEEAGSEPNLAARDTSTAALLSRAFADGVRPLHTDAPHIFRADLNGDGAEDLVAIVAPGAGAVPAGATRVHPWTSPDGKEGDLQGGSRRRLAIVHGGADGRAFLIHDPNPLSILDTAAADGIKVLSRADLAGQAGPEIADAAHGDAIVVPTEAGIDTYLLWDGTTYRAVEPIEVP